MKTGQKRRRLIEETLDGPPTSVQKLNPSSSVQEAWNILLASGLTTDQITLLQSQALAPQVTHKGLNEQISASSTHTTRSDITRKENTKAAASITSRNHQVTAGRRPDIVGYQSEESNDRESFSKEGVGLSYQYYSDGSATPQSISLQHTTSNENEILSFMDPIVSSETSQDEKSGICETCSQNHEVQKLHEKIVKLENRLAELESDQLSEAPLPPRLCYLLDTPHRVIGDKTWHLQGSKYAPAAEVLLDQNPDIVILVYYDYRCKTDSAQCSRHWSPTISKVTRGNESQTPIKYTSESMMLSSYECLQALNWIMSSIEWTGAKLEIRTEIKAPYHTFYHSREQICQRLGKLSESNQQLIQLFVDYIEQSFETSFAEANELFSQGLVSKATLPYLFEPKMHVLHYDNGAINVSRTSSWLEDAPNDPRKPQVVRRLRCLSLKFDSHFIWRQKPFTLEWSESQSEVQPITSLEVYPVKYAEDGLEKLLSSRGEKFWACRKRRYVSYDSSDLFGGSAEAGARYMIDTVMHKQMYPDAYEPSEHDEIIEDSILPVNPSNDFFLLLPPTINGYSMQLKRWVTLKVVHIEPVSWNLEAFDSLVVDADTKTLVKALVTNQLAKEKSTDLISGKGNGLIILLHGGPGTGKTLTAESVAELAKKPLYRVTCGDIGTNADAIDKHLQKVLYLGRLWGCVVLLDEADVFLEERSLADMQRNALVSVFLRVLEYYDGILVLTSNRVGTFDEAFKSRIQLSLHYGNLTRTQRRAIWDNFFKRLEKIEPDTVDTSSLYQHLDELAARDMNGRQIRNSITTARQLAMYQEKKMDYAVLKHVIGVASKFDQYVKSVKHGITDDELAREGGVR